MPSYNQIGFDSLHYLTCVVEASQSRCILWTVPGRLDETTGKTLVAPCLKDVFVLTMDCENDLVTLKNYDRFELSFMGSWDMPFGRFRLASRVDPESGKFGFLSPFAQAILILPLAAVPMGGMFMASLGLIADLTDYGEIRQGIRTEAVYFGIYGIVRKTGWAFCSLILTATFSVFGYTADNPLDVRVLWILCALFCLIGLILFIPYRLGDSMEETRRMRCYKNTEYPDIL